MNVWDRVRVILNYSVVEWDIDCIRRWAGGVYYDVEVKWHIYTWIHELDVNKDKQWLDDWIKNKIKELEQLLLTIWKDEQTNTSSK